MSRWVRHVLIRFWDLLIKWKSCYLYHIYMCLCYLYLKHPHSATFQLVFHEVYNIYSGLKFLYCNNKMKLKKVCCKMLNLLPTLFISTFSLFTYNRLVFIMPSSAGVWIDTKSLLFVFFLYFTLCRIQCTFVIMYNPNINSN